MGFLANPPKLLLFVNPIYDTKQCVWLKFDASLGALEVTYPYRQTIKLNVSTKRPILRHFLLTKN